MTHRLARRTGALAAATALAAAGLAVTPAAAGADVPGGYDAAPAARGADWLAGQLEGGLLTYQNFGFDTTDYGLSLDALLALDAVGGHEDAVADIAQAVSANLETYSDYDYSYEGVHYEGRAANAVAKSLAGLTAAGVDPRNVDGTDLVARLEALTDADGRIADVALKDGQSDPAGDYANVLGQAFAVRGLEAAASVEAPAATSFLLDQQCEEGYFRFGFGPGDLSCDAAADAAPSVDATALAVINLAPQLASPSVRAAVDEAAAWLAAEQRVDGGLGSDSDITAQNANSTGLAGWALDLAGRDDAAARAAAWVRARQLVNVGQCSPFAAGDTGAVAYDDAALATATGESITPATEGQFLRATAQALPALVQAPAGPLAATALDPRPREFYRAGEMSGPQGRSSGAPGSVVCLTVGGRSDRAVHGFDGQATPSVRLPRGTADRVGRLTTEDGATRTVTFRVLDRLAVPFTVKKKSVDRGAKQVVKVRGLEQQESYRVVFRGRTVGRGEFSGRGETVRFVVRGATGRAKVRVVGEFAAIRKATKTFRVTR